MTEQQERRVHQVPLNERRHEDRQEIIEVIRDEIVVALREVIKETAANEHALSEEEAQWVRMAIKAEAERAELRKAIIEKTLTGLVWSAICVLGVYIWDHMVAFADYMKK